MEVEKQNNGCMEQIRINTYPSESILISYRFQKSLQNDPKQHSITVQTQEIHEQRARASFSKAPNWANHRIKNKEKECTLQTKDYMIKNHSPQRYKQIIIKY